MKYALPLLFLLTMFVVLVIDDGRQHNRVHELEMRLFLQAVRREGTSTIYKSADSKTVCSFTCYGDNADLLPMEAQ